MGSEAAHGIAMCYGCQLCQMPRHGKGRDAGCKRCVAPRRADTQAAHATAMASSSGPTSASSTVTDASTLKLLASTPLSTRLNNYDAAVYGDGKAPKLVDFPPPIEAVACKPVLFDLALNKAEYPDLAKRCEKKKAGIMGWFGRN